MSFAAYDPTNDTTWELTMELKIVSHPVEFGGRHVNKLMQASRCRETGEVRWDAVRTEIGVMLEVPR